MTQVAPLFEDEFVGAPPTKRLLSLLLAQREKGKKVVGLYCTYAPLELIRAMDIIPAVLCSFANEPIEAAEAYLPANLCPLIKSSYGFLLKDACPFFGVSDAVIAETTCDGKKKMFELISEFKPLFVMDLPHLPDEPEALDNWAVVIRKLQGFLEKTLGACADEEKIEAAIKDSNLKKRLMNRAFDFASLSPPVISWKELYDILFLAQGMTGAELAPVIEGIVAKLEDRKSAGYSHVEPDAPRVLVTGCPIAGDAAKVFSIIEEAGGVVVAPDCCTGMKPYTGDDIEEGTDDPIRAIAARYLKIPCSCMTPNNRRLTQMSEMIERFKPDAVVDVVLHACHTYNVESKKVEINVQDKHGLPFMKVVTDYSSNDAGQIRTRMEALFETCG